MKQLEVRRADGRFPIGDAVRIFREFGIVVLKQYFPRSVQAALRASLESRLANARLDGGLLQIDKFPEADFLLGDVLAVREVAAMDNIFFSDECVEVVKALLGAEELCYWGDSSVQFGEAARGFHKDNVDRSDGNGDDWQSDYGLIRCGFYLQDHDRCSGGLKVRLGSHRIANHLEGQIADVATQFGDLVLWNMRLTHSGNNRRLRMLPDLPLHPRLENLVPAVACAPEAARRIAAFCSFGKPGSHLDRYIARMNERDADYRAYLQRAMAPVEAATLLSRRGVTFRQPNDYYGELDRCP